MLTRKQRDLLLFIHDRMTAGDVAPSFEEMKDALGLKSKSGIHRLINALVERGYLERMPADDGPKAISSAQMLLDDRRPEDALAALAMLPVKHTAAFSNIHVS